MKTIKLDPYGIGRYDDVSSFIIADKGLKIKVELPQVNGEFYVVAKNNGKVFKQQLVRDRETELDGLTAGELICEVKHYIKGELIKVYKIEPLLLKQLDVTLSAMPEIEALCQAITSLEEIQASTINELKTQNKRVTELENSINALIRFAYKDYKNNVYLNGGSIKDFINEFEFELSDEKINLIIGENKND